MIGLEPFQVTLTPDATIGVESTTIRWLDASATPDPQWDLTRRADDRLAIYNHATGTTVAWASPDDVFHVQDIAIEGTSSLDAGTLDGLDSDQFLRRDIAATHASDLDVQGTLSTSGNTVLSTADEGSLDAGTLAGNTLADTRPGASDDGTTVVAGVSDYDFGQYLQVTDDGDGTVTVDSVGGNAVGSTATASGDGTTTTFTLQHDLGATPASVDVTPLTEDAVADHYVTAVSATSIDLTYAAAPPSGTDNLEWHVTAFGNDGSGKHAVEVQDNSTQVDLADTFDFAGGLSVTNPSDGTVSIESPPGVEIRDNGSTAQSATSFIDFDTNLAVTTTTDGVTVTGSDTYPSVSADGSVVVGAPTDIAIGDNLTAADDGDSTVTIHASSDANTLDGVDSTQFLRSDEADDHTSTLGVTTLAPAVDTIALTGPVEPTVGTPIQHESGGTLHYARVRRDGLQGLGQGGNLPTDYGMTLEADATLAFIEPDNDRVAGWVNTNNESLTMAGGARFGDAGGDPSGDLALDVRGEARMRLENRQSDPSSPADGRIWIRTDSV